MFINTLQLQFYRDEETARANRENERLNAEANELRRQSNAITAAYNAALIALKRQESDRNYELGLGNISLQNSKIQIDKELREKELTLDALKLGYDTALKSRDLDIKEAMYHSSVLQEDREFAYKMYGGTYRSLIGLGTVVGTVATVTGHPVAGAAITAGLQAMAAYDFSNKLDGLGSSTYVEP